MQHGRVASIARYPVKSMGGESPERVRVTARGLEGDRFWAVRTPDGGLGSGKTTRRFRRVDGLLDLSARLTPDGPVVDLPDGTAGPVADPGTARQLSALLGRPVTLVPETDRPHHDDSPVHLVTTASVRRFAELAGTPVDPRRLRPNLILDVPGDGFVEDGWCGRRLAVGPEVVLALGEPMTRCAMVNAAQPGLAHDPRLLRALATGHDLELGLQATVERGGTVAVGDPVRLG